MKIDKKTKKIIIYLFTSYIIFVPLINNYVKVLEKRFGIDLEAVDINVLNLFIVIFKCKMVFIT